MVDIFPFQGYRFDKDIKKAVSQPYDIVSDKDEKELKNFKYNIAYIIKNKKHKEAGKILNEWIKENILIRESKPCIYVYEQTFSYDNKTYKRTGIILLAKVDDYKEILAHENTKEETIKDRLNLLKETRANIGLIFTYCNNNISSILDNVKLDNPIYDFEDNSEVVHKVWKIDEEDVINNIKNILKNKKIYILDGHHRYEASRRFKDKIDKVMVYITSNKESLLILDHNKISNNPGKIFPFNNITINDIIKIASKGKTFGNKATYFFPKLLSGLVIYKF